MRVLKVNKKIGYGKVEEYIEKKFYILDFSYSKSGEMDRLIYEENIQIEEKSFEERISYKVFLTKEQKEKIENLKDILIIKI